MLKFFAIVFVTTLVTLFLSDVYAYNVKENRKQRHTNEDAYIACIQQCAKGKEIPAYLMENVNRKVR